ncbi:MAG: lactate utilization protein [Candidatus Methanoperedens sp.]|nr:lactate utilization protein [Candidatus Methanoperedens sp.]
MDTDITTTLRSLKSRGINGFYAENREEAIVKILDLIPQKAVVGVGDSTTMFQIGILTALKNKGTKVLNRFEKGISKTLRDDMMTESAMCNVFLTGTNAITRDGKLVNVDAVGNRVAGMFFGHTLSVIVVGRNKLVGNLDAAFHRIRNQIAPNHIRIRSVELGGRRVKTPCVATGVCSDCNSRERMCNVFTIIEGKPLRTDINVVIINEDLGLAWDESWPKERISRIIEEYKRYVWVPAPD